MIDGDHRKGRIAGTGGVEQKEIWEGNLARNTGMGSHVMKTLPNLNRHAGCVEGRIDTIDGDRVVRVRSIAADIDHYTQTTRWAGISDERGVQEWGYLRGEVDAVHKYVH